MRAQGLHYSKSRSKASDHEPRNEPRQRIRKSDVDNFVKSVSGKSPSDKVKLSHRAFEIIPRHSPYGHHFRSLLNAENFVASQEMQMALDVYQRMLNKIPVRSIRQKIEDNINDIEDFLDVDEEEAPNRITLDVNLSGNLGPSMGPTDQTMPPQGQQGGGTPLGGGTPIELKFNPQNQQGQQGPAFGQPVMYPMVLPPGSVSDLFPGLEKPPEDTEKKGPKPFGFFQQQAANIDIVGPTPESTTKSEDDFGFLSPTTTGAQPGGKFDSTQEYEHPIMKRTNNILEGISEGIMQVEKAIFQAKNMEVDADNVDTTEEPKLPETPEEELKTEEPEKPEEEAKEELKSEESESDEPQEKERTLPPPEEDEEQSEGVLDSGADIPSLDDSLEEGPESEESEEESQVQEIRGVLELREPEQEDTPFITITYDFAKIPHHFYLSKDHNILEYAYYKYKPMLVKAQKFIQRKQITKALNYYRVIRDQQIPDALRFMIDKNINDISEYLEKYLMMRPG